MAPVHQPHAMRRRGFQHSPSSGHRSALRRCHAHRRLPLLCTASKTEQAPVAVATRPPAVHLPGPSSAPSAQQPRHSEEQQRQQLQQLEAQFSSGQASGQAASEGPPSTAAQAASQHHGVTMGGTDSTHDSPLSWWSRMAANDKLVFAATLALMLSNMGKVDMSVAIVPMSAEAGWSASVAGLVQALFYTGYMLACVPGGYIASRFGGRTALPVALGTWSLATFVAPLAAATVPTLSLTRFIVGAGQGVAPSAVVDIVARTTPASQRASATTTSFGGLHLGSVVGLLAAPPIVNTLGWQALFYIYGGLGLVWYAWFEGAVMPELAREAPELVAGLTGTVGGAKAAAAAGGASAAEEEGARRPGVPYVAFLGAREVQALMLTHFCNNMYYFTLLSWLPTYFVQDLGMDLSQASFMSMVPAATGFLVSNFAGRFADWMLAQGTPLPTVRKTVQCISMLGSAGCMLGALGSEQPSTVVALMVLGLTLHPFTLAGLFCTPNDLSTKYAGAILGLSNTCGALGAVSGIAACGLLLDATGGSWEASLYGPLIGSLLLGVYAYVAHCDNQPIDFDARQQAEAQRAQRA